jgi:hypothetical protein
MKNALVVSVLINAVLLASILCLWHRLPPNEIALISASSNMGLDTHAGHGTADIPKAELGQTRERFHWSQLESTDYRTYVVNLRSIGCPEQTIRDIIATDLHTVYAPQLAQLASAGKGAEYQSLRNAESTALLALLGPEPKAVRASSEEILVRRNQTEGVVSQSLVFEPADTKAAGLTDEQSEIVDRLQQTFIQAVGSQADASDPAYRERWLSAQRNSDDLLQGLLGGEFYLEYQLKASRRAGSR